MSYFDFGKLFRILSGKNNFKVTYFDGQKRITFSTLDSLKNGLKNLLYIPKQQSNYEIMRFHLSVDRKNRFKNWRFQKIPFIKIYFELMGTVQTMFGQRKKKSKLLIEFESDESEVNDQLSNQLVK